MTPERAKELAATVELGYRCLFDEEPIRQDIAKVILQAVSEEGERIAAYADGVAKNAHNKANDTLPGDWTGEYGRWRARANMAVMIAQFARSGEPVPKPEEITR